MIPSGNDSAAAQQYYHHLWSHYLSQINVPQIFIDPWGPIWVLIFGLSLMAFLFLFSLTENSVHRSHGDLYGLTNFAGKLTERMGRISWFNVFAITFMVLWAAYFGVITTIRGQIY